VDKAVFGLEKTRVKPEILLSAVDVSRFDAIVFVGGMGVRELYDNADAHRIIQEAVAQNKILGAIDMAPTLLAKAGVMGGRKATEYFSESKSIVAMGVEYTGSTTQQDGNIFTGKGAEASEKLGLMLAQALQQLPA
jgi:protease I